MDPGRARSAEAARLVELASYDVLDTAPEPAFDEVVALATHVSGCPIALISLLDAERQWFKARCGLAIDHTPREIAFCEYSLRADAVLVVPDTTLDARFADNPLVTGQQGVRFYAGFPLRTPSGHVLGTLCVLDTQARPAGLDEQQQRLLTALAGQVMTQLELRRALAEREQLLVESSRSEARYRALADAATDVVSRHALDGTTLYVSPSVHDVLGYDSQDEIGRPAPGRVHQDDLAQLTAALGRASEGERGSALVRSRHADGSWRSLDIRLSPVRDGSGTVVELHSTSRDVTDRELAAEVVRLSEVGLRELAAERDTARAQAVEHAVLLQTVLDTVDVGIVACGGDGRLTLFNRAAKAFHGLDSDASLDPAQWAAQYALLGADGRTPLPADQVPLVRAFTEGAVDGVDMVIAPTGLPPRLVRCTGRALRGGGDARLGAVVVMADVTAVRRVERQLAEQAEFTQVLLETAHAAMWACDAQGVPTYVNTAARRMLGWPVDVPVSHLVDSGEYSLRREALRFALPDGRELGVQEEPMVRALTEGEVRDVELVLTSGGRPARTLLVDASAIHDADGAVRGAVATGYDVTALRASEQRFRTAFHDGPTPTARLDRSGTVHEVNAAFRRFLSLRSSALKGTSLLDHAHPDDRAGLAEALAGAGTGTQPIEARFLRGDGAAVWCEVACSPSQGADGQTTVLTQLLDVHGRKAHEDVLERAALHDGLTGLANRTQLHKALEAALAGSVGLPVGLLYLDLDGFKAVNDVHGHHAGDAALVHVAAQLAMNVRPGDLVARLGGDEFAVMCQLPVSSGTAALEVLAARLERAVAAPARFQGVELRLGASVGVAVGRPGTSAKELLAAADRAMYELKRRRAQEVTPVRRV